MSAAIGVGVGLVFTYFVFATFCSGINETIARMLNTRGKALFAAINALIGDANTAANFWKHEAITGLSSARAVRGHSQLLPRRGGSPARLTEPDLSTMIESAGGKVTGSSVTRAQARALPSYISPDTFAAVWADLASAGGTLQFPGLTSLGKDVQADLSLVAKIFNDAMDRLSGLYKRHVQVVLLALSVVAVVAFNVDTLHVAKELWRQPALQASITSKAQSAVTSTTTATTGNTGAAAVASSLGEAENLPVGWGTANVAHGAIAWLLMILGWLLSIGAIALGAPFWFDVLSALNSLRSTGPPPKT